MSDVPTKQCNQMAALFVHYLAIYSNENLYNDMQNCQILNESSQNSQKNYILQKVRNFGICIWSHCYQEILPD